MSMTSTVSNTVHPEEYLHLVDTVISLYITQRIDIADMEYADLYQTGCLALCHAAATYDPEREASFSTYASVVIRNRLYDYCRHVNHVHSQLLYLVLRWQMTQRRPMLISCRHPLNLPQSCFLFFR